MFIRGTIWLLTHVHFSGGSHVATWAALGSASLRLHDPAAGQEDTLHRQNGLTQQQQVSVDVRGSWEFGPKQRLQGFLLVPFESVRKPPFSSLNITSTKNASIL